MFVILNTYSKIWNRIEDLIRKDFDAKVIHNYKYISIT